jgi:flagellar hook-basal body complex protein FliE
MASEISPVSGVRSTPIAEPRSIRDVAKPTADEKPSFENVVTRAVAWLEGQQKEADAKAADFATGGQTELHDVMLAAEKLNLSFQLTLQVRNKVVEAYQEIMRMQV